MSTLFLNGDWVASDRAQVSVFDRGFLFADGIYEVIPVYKGRLFLAERHLQRLSNSLNAIDIANPYSFDQWLELCQQVIKRNQHDDALIYLQVTRGAESARSHLPGPSLTPTVMITASPMAVHWNVPEPVRVCLLEDIRWLRCDIKSISLLGNIMLKQQAASQGGAEPLLHRDGVVTEGASCNFFIVRDKVLFTPPKDHLILPGITRDWVIKLAEDNGIEVRQQSFSVAELLQADECFLTSSSREVQPVAWVDDATIADAKVGPVTIKLADLFHQSKQAVETENAN